MRKFILFYSIPPLASLPNSIGTEGKRTDFKYELSKLKSFWN